MKTNKKFGTSLLQIAVVFLAPSAYAAGDADAFLEALGTPSVKKAARKADKPVAVAAPPVAPVPEPTPAPAAPTSEVAQAAPSSRLLGDDAWGRPWLAERGLQFDAVYRGELVSNLSGGLERKSTWLGLLDVTLAGGEAGWFKDNGIGFLLHGEGAHGGDPSLFIGDAQVSSNVEAPNTFKLYQAWIEKSVSEGAASLRVGLYDLNSEFYVTDSSLQLFNSSFGIGMDMSQSGANGPSIYPTGGLAARARLTQGSLYMQTAVLEGIPGSADNPYGTHISLSRDEGALLVGEFGYAADSKYAFGAWSYTAPTEELAVEGEEAANGVASGAYVLLDQKLDDRRKVFLRAGWASGAVHEYSAGYAAGLLWKGLVPEREDDLMSFGVAYAHASSRFREVQAAGGVFLASGETAIELNYRAEITPGFAVLPDFQYIHRPSADPSVPDAFVGTLRIELGL